MFVTFAVILQSLLEVIEEFPPEQWQLVRYFLLGGAVRHPVIDKRFKMS